MNGSRKYLSATGLYNATRAVFQKISMPQVNGNRQKPITLTDCLMSGLAIFSLKFQSLLQFDTEYAEKAPIRHNLKMLFGVENAPSDTYLRERLDVVPHSELRKVFTHLLSLVQRGGALKDFAYLNGYYLLSLDGTGFFSSHDVQCQNCCVKEHKNGTKTYYHQMLCGAIVHPGEKTVIPFAPEPIMKGDGSTKNDCEFNAAKRFIEDLKREHPHLKVIILADGLFSKGPFIKLLKESEMLYIIGAKPGDHKYLFEFTKDICQKTEQKKDGKRHQFSFVNNVPLNDDNYDLNVNFLDYFETDSKGKTQHFTWITNIEITKDNVYKIMKGGRARWKIENETFNTLKNQNYHFEHNFGHGKKYLSSVFAMLMMLAFMIDQIQERCDALFQQALIKEKRKSYLWESLRSLFRITKINSWEDIWNSMAYGHIDIDLQPRGNTS